MTRKIHNPTSPVEIGTPVWFMANGDPSSTPLPGFVVSMGSNLVACITYFLPDGGWDRKMSCYPLGSQLLYDNAKRLNRNARDNGAWTYNPHFIPQEFLDAARDAEIAKKEAADKEAEMAAVQPESLQAIVREPSQLEVSIDDDVDPEDDKGEWVSATAQEYSDIERELVLRLFEEKKDVELVARSVRFQKIRKATVMQILSEAKVIPLS